MSIRWRSMVILAVLALVIAACSSIPAAVAPPLAAAAFATASVEPSAAAAEPVTIDWWHIGTGDPGKKNFQAIAYAQRGGPPEREDQHHGRLKTRSSRRS